VGFSYGANVVLTALLAAPELVSKAVLVEPALDTVLPHDAVSHEAIAPRNATLKAVGAELQRGDDAAAMRLLAEWTDNGHTAGWEAADPHYLAMLEANVPTLRMLFAAPQGEPIDCAKLQKIKVRTLVINGSETRPFYSLVGKRVAACIPAAESVILGGASHDSANQVPALFNATILEFLGRGDS
jgi:pimeloyl-ACP methyl ester carboxylesterase